MDWETEAIRVIPYGPYNGHFSYFRCNAPAILRLEAKCVLNGLNSIYNNNL